MQKQVKIIGLQVNEKFGILESCKVEFDKNNHLIAVKGEVGSGKTTLQKSIMLGTLGSDTLKDDKNLYGAIDQEVQLLDGYTKIYVGYKSDKDGSLKYVIYCKDEDGKIIKDPVVDGVKLTPSKYLKSLQTSLTWRMDELTSENPTIQKKILLDLYKSDLENVGVIFDKSHLNYKDSILYKIENAKEERSEKEYKRKQVGGFANHLLTQGFDVEKEETLPKFIDVDDLQRKISRLTFELENSINIFETEKDNKIQKIISSSKFNTMFLVAENLKITEANKEIENEFIKRRTEFDSKKYDFNKTIGQIKSFYDRGILSIDTVNGLVGVMEANCKLEIPKIEKLQDKIPFEDGKCIAKEWSGGGEIEEKIKDIIHLRNEYTRVSNIKFENKNEENEKELEILIFKLKEAKESNKICLAVDSFREWSEVNKLVSELMREYALKLAEINTGVDGLKIEFEEVGEKINVHLMYNGEYSPDYFSNKTKEFRKLSSYSGTQKPLICLLIQNYLLSKKTKALRYLWIDNVPIDKKTRILLEEMGKELDLTTFINITGDFEANKLENGEILLNGGQIFFK